MHEVQEQTLDSAGLFQVKAAGMESSVETRQAASVRACE